MDPIILIIFFQIIIESFPVSSSGHILLLEKLLYRFGFEKLVLPEHFDYFLHGPTILILMVLFWRDWFFPIKRLLRCYSGQTLIKIFLKICGFVFTTTIIALIFHFIIDKHFKNTAWFSSDYVLFIGFCITAGLLFLLLNKEYPSRRLLCNLLQPSQAAEAHRAKASRLRPTCRTNGGACHESDKGSRRITFKKVLIIGIVQGIALFPGISRFATVYAVSRLLNVSARRAFQFTFLIQFPLIVPGFFLGFFKLTKMLNWTSFFSFKINFTFLFATILGFFALWWMRRLAYNRKIGLFCFYMLIPIFVLFLLAL